MSTLAYPQNRVFPYIVVAVGYASYVVLVILFFEQVGWAIAPWTIIPVIAGGWYFGIRGGLLTAALCTLTNIILPRLFGYSLMAFVEATGNLAGATALFILAFIIGKISTVTSKRKEAEAALLRREAILRAVSLTSELFLKTANWERNVPTALERLGKAAHVSRVYIFERHFSREGASLISQRYEWAGGGIAPQIEIPVLQDLAWRQAGYERWEDTFERHQFISGLVRDFPASEREILAEQGILSLAVMPIFAEEKLWGFIGFDECNHERQWPKAELDALRTAADIFGAALVRQKIQSHLLKRQRSLDLLQEILHAALSKSEIDEMGQFLVDHLGILIQADNCFLSLWDEERQQMIPLAAYGPLHEKYRTVKFLPGEKTLTASVLEAGYPLVIEDVKDSPYFSRRIIEEFPIVSMLALPMISNGRKLGAVFLGFAHRHQFSQDEIIIGEQATNLVALAMAKLQAVEQARRRAAESETLRRAGAAVAETLDMQEATTRILQQLAHVLPYDSASVQLLLDGELEIIGGEGFKSSVIGMRFPAPGDNTNTVVLQTRRPYLLHEANKFFPAFRQPPHDHIR
ncbi:MAG TPA: GAF domain-containing protein, partial [Anaerolineales bacterium]|nr:GAF domain-containing protein [Anaerolineales bacterium]